MRCLRKHQLAVVPLEFYDFAKCNGSVSERTVEPSEALTRALDAPTRPWNALSARQRPLRAALPGAQSLGRQQEEGCDALLAHGHRLRRVMGCLAVVLSSTSLTGCHELYCSSVEGPTGEPIDCSHEAFPDLGIDLPPLAPPPSLPTTTTTEVEPGTTSTSTVSTSTSLAPTTSTLITDTSTSSTSTSTTSTSTSTSTSSTTMPS